MTVCRSNQAAGPAFQQMNPAEARLFVRTETGARHGLASYHRALAISKQLAVKIASMWLARF